MWMMLALIQMCLAEVDVNWQWRVVNDTVMGGRSTAKVEAIDNGWQLTGNVSLENNGGFASIRSQNTIDLTQAASITVRLEGTPDSVQLVLWVGQGANLYYAVSIRPQAAVQTIPLSSFQAKSYGRLVRAPALESLAIPEASLGILVGDGIEGPFTVRFRQLSIESLAVSIAPEERTEVDWRESILRAIERGVPLYNSGDPKACALIYQTVLEDLLILVPHKLSATQRTEIQQVLAASDGLSMDEQAWAYRRQLDRILSGA